MGLGDDDPARNPFAASRLPALEALAGGRWLAGLAEQSSSAWTVRRLDAHMGDAGLPQSATGQTALLTGRDAVAVMGHPYGPWPGPTLLQLLEEGNLFHDGAKQEGGAVLTNAYPQGFLDAVASRRGRHRRLRPSTAMAAASAAGLRLRSFDDLRGGVAVGPDFDGDTAGLRRQAGYLGALAEDHAFSYLDLWRTDQAGHAADMVTGRRVVQGLDTFLEALLPLPSDLTLLLTADHGNLEDLGHGSHTHAQVPLIVIGPGAPAFTGVSDLRGVAPALRAWWAGSQIPTTSNR